MKKTLAVILASLIVVLIVAAGMLPFAWLLNLGWGAIAYQFNLPTFTFWQMYGITCALLLVLKPVIKVNCHGKKDD